MRRFCHYFLAALDLPSFILIFIILTVSLDEDIVDRTILACGPTEGCFGRIYRPPEGPISHIRRYEGENELGFLFRANFAAFEVDLASEH